MTAVNGGGRQLRLAGLSLKVRGKGKRGPSLSTFRLPAITSSSFEVDVDTELHLQLTGPDGEVGFKKHRPARGQPWIERIHSLTAVSGSEVST